MAFHKVFPLTPQWMGIELFWNFFTICKFVNYLIKQLDFLQVFAKTLEIFLKLRGFTNFFDA